MLISDTHEFIFVHIRKSAGSSIRDTLEPISIQKPTDTWSKIKGRFLNLETDYRHYPYRQHQSIHLVKKIMPEEVFDRYFKFAFVRNPWDRLISEYEFVKRSDYHGRNRKVRSMSFDEYIDYQAKRRDAHQVNMLCDKKGQVLIDFVAKFERLQEDWKYVCDRLQLEGAELSHRKNSKIKDYSQYYSDQTSKKVAELWARDAEVFDYENPYI